MLASYYWLPLQCKMDFNILLIASKAHLKLAPSYFSSLWAVGEILRAKIAFWSLEQLSNFMTCMKYWKIEILVTGQEKVWKLYGNTLILLWFISLSINWTDINYFNWTILFYSYFIVFVFFYIALHCKFRNSISFSCVWTHNVNDNKS